MEFEERLNRANGRLKAAKIRVRLQVLNQKLYARGTFPPAPGSTQEAPHQQRIALGLPANPRGLSLAEEQAKGIGVALEAGRFDWGPYRGDRAETVGDWVERFRRRWRGAPITWKTDYQQPFNKLPKARIVDQQIDASFLGQHGLDHLPDTRRVRHIQGQGHDGASL